jgi:hypothetical protein
MAEQGSLFEETSVDRAAAHMETLRRVHAGAVRRGTKAANVPMAHGLVYDPHIDGKLKLTPAGLAKVRAL